MHPRTRLYSERGTGQPLHEALSDRELEVMSLIASGKTVSQIAELLSLSDKTISTYRARILEKMHMKTNAELTYYTIQNKLVSQPTLRPLQRTPPAR
jgi:two-component system invasion response regulator UvrY